MSIAGGVQIFGALIADDQQVYGLNYLDDQLILGVNGTLSVVELKVLRQRLQAGQESKACRGELFKRLPVGYARDPMGKVSFIPIKRPATQDPAQFCAAGSFQRALPSTISKVPALPRQATPGKPSP